MMYAEFQNPPGGKAEFTVGYEIKRLEYSRGDYEQLERVDRKPSVVPASMSRLILPDTLIPTDGKMQQLATRVTGSQTGTVAKAKAAYDYFFTNMRYDKTGSGWGRGDALWACDSKRGNCTDFHSPFIPLCELTAPGPLRYRFSSPCGQGKRKYCWLSLLG